MGKVEDNVPYQSFDGKSQLVGNGVPLSGTAQFKPIYIPYRHDTKVGASGGLNHVPGIAH